MKTIAEQILDGLNRFYTGFQTRRVLKTMEEVNANTDAQNIPSALLLGELNNKLMPKQKTFSISQTGQHLDFDFTTYINSLSPKCYICEYAVIQAGISIWLVSACSYTPDYKRYHVTNTQAQKITVSCRVTYWD